MGSTSVMSLESDVKSSRSSCDDGDDESCNGDGHDDALATITLQSRIQHMETTRLYADSQSPRP